MSGAWKWTVRFMLVLLEIVDGGNCGICVYRGGIIDISIRLIVVGQCRADDSVRAFEARMAGMKLRASERAAMARWISERRGSCWRRLFEIRAFAGCADAPRGARRAGRATIPGG